MSEHGEQCAVPQVHPDSIELALFYLDFQSWTLLRDDSETQKRLAEVRQKILENPKCAADLRKLIDAGCNEELLLWYLAMLSGRHASPVMQRWFDQPGPESLRNLLGLDSRQLDSLKRKLLDCADRVETVNAEFYFGTLLLTPHLNLFQPIPRLLRGYVSLLQLAGNKMAGGKHIHANFAKAALIAHVHRRTNAYFDDAVSELIATATNQLSTYNEHQHQNWRQEHADLIASLDADLRKPKS